MEVKRILYEMRNHFDEKSPTKVIMRNGFISIDFENNGLVSFHRDRVNNK